MKKIVYVFSAFCLMFLVACGGQSTTENGGKEEKEEKKEVKASPYEKASAKINKTKLTINYSSPRTKGRDVWGALVPYDEIWRTGADEATVFETSTAITIEGQKLEAGKYAFFTIPGEEEWTVIFNNVHKQWGAFNYDEAQDALRVKVKPMLVEEHTENMTFHILETSEGEGEIKFAWAKLKVAVGFKVE